jgi:hypothetical protein
MSHQAAVDIIIRAGIKHLYLATKALFGRGSEQAK